MHEKASSVIPGFVFESAVSSFCTGTNTAAGRDILKLQEQGPSLTRKKSLTWNAKKKQMTKNMQKLATPESGDAETENTGTDAETSGQEKPEIPEDTETPQEPESSENLEDSEVTESPEKPENSENPESPETPEDSEESKEPETPQDQPEDSETSGKEETEGETALQRKQRSKNRWKTRFHKVEWRNWQKKKQVQYN